MAGYSVEYVEEQIAKVREALSEARQRAREEQALGINQRGRGGVPFGGGAREVHVMMRQLDFWHSCRAEGR